MPNPTDNRSLVRYSNEGDAILERRVISFDLDGDYIFPNGRPAISAADRVEAAMLFESALTGRTVGIETLDVLDKHRSPSR